MRDRGYLDRLRDELVAAAGRRSRKRSAAAFAGGAAVLVIGAMGLVAWLGSGGSEVQPIASTAAPTMAAATTAPATTVAATNAPATTVAATNAPATTVAAPTTSTAPPEPAEWVEVPDPRGVLDGTAVSAVVSVGEGWVAAGSLQSDQPVGVMWQSDDGLIWSRVEPPDQGPDAFVSDLAVAGAELLAAGTAQLGAVVWSLDAAGSWQRVLDDPGPPDAGFASVNAVAVTGSGLMAGGTVAETQGGDRARAAVWVAGADGAWQRRDADSFGGATGIWSITGLAASAGTVVAVGVLDHLDATSEPVAWYSGDGGDTWAEAEVAPGLDFEGFAGMTGVVHGGPGFVAVGFDQGSEGAAAIWTSRDGTRWGRVPHDPELFGGELGRFARMNEVTAAPGRLVAVGFERRGLDLTPLAWESQDGTKWTVAELGSSEGLVFDVAAGGDVLLAVGAGATDGRVWVSPPPASFPEPPPATTTTTTRAEPTQAPDTALAASLFPDTISAREPVTAYISGVRPVVGEDGFVLIWLFAEASGEPVQRVCRPRADVVGNQVVCTFLPGGAGEALPPGRYLLGAAPSGADPAGGDFQLIPRDVLIVTGE